MPHRFDRFRHHFSRYRWLRDYYLMQHLRLALPRLRLTDEDGTLLGYLDAVEVHRGRVHLRGWARAPAVTLRLGDAVLRRRPRAERADIAGAPGCAPRPAFAASLPLADGPLLIEIERAGQAPLRLRHALPIAPAMAVARLRLGLRFWRETLPLLPMIVRGLRSADTDLPRRVKVALRLGEGESHLVLEPAFLAAGGGEAAAPPARGVSIVMPVHNAFELLPEALGRVAAHTDLPWRLILIEDASTDPRVRPWLRDWVRAQEARFAGRIDLLENDRNLGFIRSVNRGFDRLGAGDDPVVLLNSDALVPPGWAARLTAPLRDPSVATATPLSSDAEILSAPVICVPTPLAPGQGDRIDAALRAQISSTAPRVEVPTGVGFCMAIRRDWLARIGAFDTDFGPGYGEEVDWCRRAAARGGRHVAVPGLYVEHRGGVSFGEAKRALIQKNNAIIARRYPGYDRMVQEFVQGDPLVTPRLVAALAWADTLDTVDAVPVFIAHSMGGGAESHLQDRLRATPVSVVLRFGGAHRCRIEVSTPAGRLVAGTEDLDLVHRLIRAVRRRRIVYSCAVGDPDLGALPDFILRLAEGAPLEVLFHDYLPLSPSYTLLDEDGVYRGVPDPGREDAAHRYRGSDGGVVPLAEWRARWGRIVAAAETLVVFSTSSAGIVQSVHPRARLSVRPHRLPRPVPPLTVPAGDPVVIGVLGAIGPQKGAAVVAALAARLRDRPGIDLALIGRIAPGFALPRSVPVHGVYAVEDIPALAARYGVTHWLIPSIWPETFSFTVHECLATGFPVLAFDLGAQGDAVRAAPNGIVLPWEAGARQPEALAQLVIDALERQRRG